MTIITSTALPVLNSPGRESTRLQLKGLEGCSSAKIAVLDLSFLGPLRAVLEFFLSPWWVPISLQDKKTVYINIQSAAKRLGQEAIAHCRAGDLEEYVAQTAEKIHRADSLAAFLPPKENSMAKARAISEKLENYRATHTTDASHREFLDPKDFDFPLDPHSYNLIYQNNKFYVRKIAEFDEGAFKTARDAGEISSCNHDKLVDLSGSVYSQEFANRTGGFHYTETQLKKEIGFLEELRNKGPFTQILSSFISEVFGFHLILKKHELGSLADYAGPHALLSKKTLTLEETYAIGFFILQAFSILHANQICHNDFKLGNTFLDQKVDENGKRSLMAFVGDFGFSYKVSEEPDLDYRSLGTRFYKAPEKRISSRNPGLPSDIWSIGLSLYYLFEKHLDSEFKTQVESQVLTPMEKSPTKMGLVGNTYKEGTLEHLICGLLQKDPAKRFSAKEAFSLYQHLDFDALQTSKSK